MNIHFTPMTLAYAKQIDSWNYEGFVEQVMMTPYFESLSETGQLIGPGGCDGFIAIYNDEPIGLFEFNVEDQGLEIGLALKPEFTGKGWGEEYVKQGIDFGIRHYTTSFTHVQLVVEKENKAAIRVYEKVGFQKQKISESDMEMKLELT
ncbi:GNAT family N-acetyltransferase [Halobacillus locisalis]|uniref:GNAT family N-acetyltransferase n=1 Tax=Halobacillus locisalis TaxID=220753 RepID=A0A838CVE9_9BACI|nr:GNAT family N-acetyltransferase [Halobacillus locisalis]MBA2175898.1 GNAT family N-acetyltransferase [Halobacillus locisalis]